MVTGLLVDEAGFEVVANGEQVGQRRSVEAADIRLLRDLAMRYVRAVNAGAGDETFIAIGRGLFRWVDGDDGQLARLLDRPGPLVFEVQGPWRPSEAAWAVLRAPFELLARPDGGFLARNALDRFCVFRRLGTATAGPEMDRFRLGLAFMASSPRGQAELDFEAEEAAILAAVGETRTDLLVEDTGDPSQLGARLADAGGMPVVHLSCHGTAAWRDPNKPNALPVPVLLMEDDEGGAQPVTAAGLVQTLTVRPRLLFLSACQTAARAGDGHLPGGVNRKDVPDRDGNELAAYSLATALVSSGVPAVLGWDGSVADRAATLFAAGLYRRLSERVDLVVAVGDARRDLLNAEDPQVRADWHLARLWLGPSGGGPLVGGTQKRLMVPATRGTRVFLDRKRQVPVARPELLVGRRLELQQALRALRSGERAGVLLHGLGRLGKSSLAARIADRLPDYALVVVYGDYSAKNIADTVADAVRTIPAAREMIESRRAELHERPERIEWLLADLLAGPCQQVRDGGKPLLLIIDDLEQVLKADPAGAHRVAAGVAPTLAGVLLAFDPAESDSRVLLTSRFTFALDGLEGRLERVPLRPLSEVGQQKLQRRQLAAALAELPPKRTDLGIRAVAVARGNPGLQDLAVRLAYGEHVTAERAESAIAGMERYLSQGELPADAETREFLEDLAIDAVLKDARPDGVALLRAATLFGIPVPEPVIFTLASEVGGSLDRLQGLSLLVPYPDRYNPQRVALAPDPLAAGRVGPLTSAEETALAAITIDPLLTAWGGHSSDRQGYAGLDLQLAWIALLAGNPEVTATCGFNAMNTLLPKSTPAALRLGQDMVALLDRCGNPVPSDLLRVVSDVAFVSGDNTASDALLDRIVRQIKSEGTQESLLAQAQVVWSQVTRLVARNDLSQAENLAERARKLFIQADSQVGAATASRLLATVSYKRGDYVTALDINRKVLPIFERAGNHLWVTDTQGSIADIAYQRKEYDEAEIRWRELLEVYTRHGNSDMIAHAKQRLGQIDFSRGDYNSAVARLAEVNIHPVDGE